MKPSPSAHDSAAEEQASLWAARLDGDTLDRAQRAELDAWLARDPRHRVLLSSYCQFSADLEEQVPAVVAAGRIALPTARAVTRRRWGFPQLAGLGLAAAAAIAVAFVVLRPGAAVENFATAVAQRQTHTLADGTRVELNAHTTLRFEQDATGRHARLSGGEALFIVAKDAARPFTVETQAGSVRVTGTTFNVRTAPASAVSLEVLVVEGSVQVRPSDPTGRQRGEPFSLKAGDRLSAGTQGVEVSVVSEAAIENALAWREGYAVFAGVPLSEAAACFARYHGRRIDVAPAVAGLRLGARYRLDDLQAFAAALEVALPVRVSEDLGGVMAIEPRAAR
jgi:transmembrane sensor